MVTGRSGHGSWDTSTVPCVIPTDPCEPKQSRQLYQYDFSVAISSEETVGPPAKNIMIINK